MWTRGLIYAIVEDQADRDLDLELFGIMNEVYSDVNIPARAVLETYIERLTAWARKRRLFPASTATPKVSFFLSTYPLYGMNP